MEKPVAIRNMDRRLVPHLDEFREDVSNRMERLPE